MAGQPSMSRALARRENIAGYLFMLPSLIFFVGFVVIPMVICIYTSFLDSNMNQNAPDTGTASVTRKCRNILAAHLSSKE